MTALYPPGIVWQRHARIVTDYAALQAIAIAGLVDGRAFMVMGRTAVMDGGGGDFLWQSGDQSALVTGDPQKGLYIPPTSDLTGASGCYVRVVGSKSLDPRWFGAKGDAILVSGLSTTLASAIATSATAMFTASMVGKTICIMDGAAPSGGGTASTILIRTVLSVDLATQITMSGTAGATVAATDAVVGTDDRVALQALADYAHAVPYTSVKAAGQFLIGGHPDVVEHVWYAKGDHSTWDFSDATFFGNTLFGATAIKPYNLTLVDGTFVVLGDNNKDGTTGSVNWNALACVHGDVIKFTGTQTCIVMGGGARAASLQTSTAIANSAGVPNLKTISVERMVLVAPVLPAAAAKSTGLDVSSAIRDGLIEDVDLGDIFIGGFGEGFNATSGGGVILNSGLDVASLNIVGSQGVGARFYGIDDVSVKSLKVDGLSPNSASGFNGRALEVRACDNFECDNPVIVGDDVAGLDFAITVVDAGAGGRARINNPRVSMPAGAANKWAVGIYASAHETLLQSPDVADCTLGINVLGGYRLVIGGTTIFRDCTTNQNTLIAAYMLFERGITMDVGVSPVSYHP